METRRLGRTGHRSTVVTFGTAGIGRVSQDIADKAVETVLQYNVNHVDIAPSYGQAMERMAPWMSDIRDKVFLGSKTRARTGDEARADINDIMLRLKIDRFDLFQLHAVTDMVQLDHVTEPGGALEALTEMRDQGQARWLGITGHGPQAPRVQLEALRRFDFDTIMFPVNASMFRDSNYRRDVKELLGFAGEKDVGVQAIKMIARGGWGDSERDCTTWYDPHREQSEIDRALWWLLSQPVHTAPSAGDVNLLTKVLDAAARFERLDTVEQENVVECQRPPLPEPALSIPPA